MTTQGTPNEGLTGILDDRFNGNTVTLHLTDGLTYSTATTAANVTAASVGSDSVVAGASSINGVTGDAELSLSFTINGGVGGIDYDGYAFLVNGTVDAYVDFETVNRTIGIGEDRTFYYTPRQSSSVIYGG